jgi:2-polyprenyl-3-methyl-5-hydroxy-6-metoxy-1,4-benzoquinol methylase
MNKDLNVKRDQYYMAGRHEMIKYIPTTAKRILEIGCGEGNFGAMLKTEMKLEVWGIEYQQSRASEAATKLDKVLCGDVFELIDQVPEAYFDAIVCNDVLEHLLDPYKVLGKAKTKLAQGGVVVSSIPNIRYFRNLYKFVFNRTWDYEDQGIMDFTHFRFFTIDSIRKMYENLDYQVILHEGIHGTKSLKPWFFILFSFGYFSDIRYLQFVTVAKNNK